MESNQFISKMAKIRESAMFISLRGYKSKNGEIADFIINFHVSYVQRLKKSLLILSNYQTEDSLEAIAKKELMDSFKNSIANIENNELRELKDGYSRFENDEGKIIKGLKVNNKTQNLILSGEIVSKKVIKPGVYKKTNKKPETIVKDKLRKLCEANRFREFIIEDGNLDEIKVEKETLSFKE